MTHLDWIAWAAGGMLLVAALAAGGAAAEKTYSLAADDHGMVLRTPDGRTVLGYMTKKPAQTKLTANSVCCLYPLKTPAGEDAVDFAPADHPHHRGVFMTWHAIAGKTPADFWGWGHFAPTKGRVIANRSIKLAAADSRQATIDVQNDWTADGETLIEETTTVTVREQSGAFLVDLDFHLTPKADLTLRQSAFGGLCVKARKGAHGTYADAKGEVKLPPPHHLKPETDWPAAAWYDYTFEAALGKRIGVAVVDHPENPPSAWHNLGAISMINPCIVAPGPVELKAGKPLRLRYRLVVHDGAAGDLVKQLAEAWRAPGPTP